MSRPETTTASSSTPDLTIDAVSPPRPGRWVAAALTAFVIVWLAWTIIVNENLHWDIVVQYQFDSVILEGLWVTIQLTVISMVIGVVLGVIAALMQLSDSRIMRLASATYIWFFRGTPLLVQLLFWYNIAVVFPNLAIGVPFGGPDFVSVSTNAVITGFVASLLGLSINEGAYMSEIVRAGLQSVPAGQREAAESMGMSRAQVMRRVVLPQAMRFIIPPTGNQFISMLKTTSLVAMIAGHDLLTVSQRIYLKNFEVIAMLMVASIWYIVLTTIASIGQHYVERHFGRGYGTTKPIRSRTWRNLTRLGGAS